MNSIEAPTPKLPLIDFRNRSSAKDDDHEVKPGTPCWDSLKSQVGEALEGYGCFEAAFDEVRSDVFRSLEELFDLPLSTKQRHVSNSMTSQQGYFGHHPLYSHMETFGIDVVPNSVVAFENFASTLWTQGGNPSFSESIRSLYEKLSGVDEMVRRMVIEGFGLEKYMDEHMSSTIHQLRVMKYTAPGDLKLVLRVHTDKTAITILGQNEVDGLEIQTKGGEWIPFRPSYPGSFIVIAGDSLHAWLNGRVHNPYHRVMLSGKDPRYSFSLWINSKADSIIKAPEELIDEQHPLRYKPFVAKEYFALAYSPSGYKEAAPLQTFYGIPPPSHNTQS